MGEVYRARDTKLNRDVALKVLPDLFADDPERLARFQREAQVLASLNHPNIGVIYGLEESAPSTGPLLSDARASTSSARAESRGSGQAVRALVLEFVDGPTLGEVIAQGSLSPGTGERAGVRGKGLPLDEAIPIARQIADALEAAHEQGVIHRDLKPANVKVKADGVVKVLDFGLAKALDPVAQGFSPAEPIDSPTMTAAATRAGVIMGTAAYMSPEQAKGRAADKRADVWAFGVVVYEMLTGKRAFVGDDVSDTLAGVLRAEAAWDALPQETPARLRQVLRACLQKDPKHRVRDIGDVRLAMEGVFETAVPETSEAPAVPHAPRLRPWQRPVPAVIGALALVGFTGLAVWSVMRPGPPPSGAVTRFPLVLPSGDQFSATGRHVVAVSPDGTLLVYVANQQLYLRTMDQMEATPIRGTEAEPHGRSPFFSADGQWIGFWAEAQLKKVSVSGGAPVTLCDAENPWGASWGADDTILFGQGPAGIWQVPGTGGAAEAVITVEEGEQAQSPQMLPGGEWVLFTLRPSVATSWDESQIVVQSLASRERRVLINGGKDARYVPTGHLVYALEGTLLAVPFDAEQLTVTPGPVPLVEGVADAAAVTGAAHFGLSRGGALVYVPGGSGEGGENTLVWVDRQGQSTPLAGATAGYSLPRLSPDETRVAVNIGGTSGDIWICEVQRGACSRLTTEGGHYPVWTPDGTRVTFNSSRAGDRDLYWKPADGSGEAELLLTRERTQYPISWSPDGQVLAFSEGTASTGDIWLLPLEGEPEELVVTSFSELSPTFSPDGRWLAYRSNESGEMQLYVRPYPGPGGRQLVSLEGGEEPVWSRDGRELFFRDGDRLMVVEIESRGSTFSVGTPRFLFEGYNVLAGGTQNYDVSRDGQRFVMVRPGSPDAESAQASAQLHVVLNWFEELRQRVPTN